MLTKYRSVLLAISIFLLVLTNVTQAQSWTQLTWSGSTPATRYGHTAVYDNTNNLMTIYGGINLLNDVWVLSHANGLGATPAWTQLSPTGSAPTTRFHHTAVYDTTNNIMTIFGGEAGPPSLQLLNDVWILSNANGIGGTPAWTQLSPTGSAPNARYGHTAVYDATNNRMTIFGGYYNGGTNFLNDVWVLSNANGLDSTTSAWIRLFPTGGLPPARFGHTAVYDNTNNRMIIFGGVETTPGNEQNDVWVLSNANGLDTATPSWTQLSPTGSTVTSRVDHTAVYDGTNNQMTIFGGQAGSPSYPRLNDVCVLSNANGLGGTPSWTQLSPPEASRQHDTPILRSSIISISGCSSLGDMILWVF